MCVFIRCLFVIYLFKIIYNNESHFACNTVLSFVDSAKLDPGFTHIHQKSAEYNQTVTFSLNVIANPLPTYKWSRYYNNNRMPLLAKSVVKSGGLTSNLTIPMTTKHDMLSYICAVKNTVGLKKFIFELNPAGNYNFHF